MALVNLSNRSIQILFNFARSTSMDSQVTTSYRKSGTEDPKSSDINDIIRSVLNILFFFYKKVLQV